MKIELKHKCKPNGANEFKLGGDYAIESSQWLVCDETVANAALLELLTAKATVAVQAKIRAEFGDGKSEADLRKWTAHVAAWNGREVSPEFLVSPTSATGTAKAVLAAAEAAISRQMAKGMDRATATELVYDMLGIKA